MVHVEDYTEQIDNEKECVRQDWHKVETESPPIVQSEESIETQSSLGDKLVETV